METEQRTPAQLRVIHLVVKTLRVAGCSAWLFGGWGLDARIGRITREHDDIEFWVDRADGERSRATLEQYPALRNGGPWRAKDQADVEALRVLASKSGATG